MTGEQRMPFFETAIMPHRSLTPRGLRIVIAVVCILCCLTTLRFLVVGAWPVIVFNAIEIGAAVLLLWINARRGRALEVIALSDDGVCITRTDASGRKESVEIASPWVQVIL